MKSNRISNYLKLKWTLQANFILLLVLISSISCKKSTIINKRVNSQILSDVAVPNVVNGVLEFTSNEHYTEWLEYLNNTIIKDTLTDDSTSQDSILHAIEIGIGFNSLRQKTYEEFEAENVNGWDNIEVIPERCWINDITIQSTLNEYEEVKIGNDIISYFDLNRKFNISDWGILQNIRDFKASGNMDIHSIFEDGQIVQSGIKINDIVQVGNLSISDALDCASGDVRAASKGTSDDLIHVFGSSRGEDCANRKVILDGYYLLDPSTQARVQAQYSVNWGDGSGYHSIGTLSTLSTSYIYASASTYIVTVRATVGSSNYYFSDKVEAKNQCGRGNKKITVWHYPLSGWAIRATTWNEANNSATMRAKTESFKWQNGKWRNRKCDYLFVQVSADDVDAYCGFITTKSVTNASRNDRSLTSSRVELSKYAWSNNSSSHGIYVSGNWHTVNQSYTPCP